MISLAIISSVLLLIVGNLQIRVRLSVRLACTVLILSILLCSFALKPIIRFLNLRATTVGERLIKNNIQEIKSYKAIPDNLILIDGGSYPTRGLNYKLLKKLLDDKGCSVEILQFTIAGGNHFERFHYIKNFFDDLTHRDLMYFEKSNFIVMLEVNLGYDMQPLAQFNANKFTIRTIEYSTLSNVIAEWDTLYLSDKNITIDVSKRDLLSHAFLNYFNIGLLSRIDLFGNLRPVSGYRPINKVKKGYKFNGFENIIKDLRRISPSNRSFGWVSKTKERRLKDVLSPYADTYLYYSVPSLVLLDLEYQRSFCNQLSSTLFINPLDFTLLRELNKSEYWYNNSHLSEKGSEIYTKWLAQQLIDSETLKR